MITFDFNKTGNRLNCILHGRLGADNAQELSKKVQDKMDEFKNDGLKINFDLKEVDYIASSFIRICVATAKQLQDGHFSISNTNPMIKKVFKISGLDEILKVT